MARPATRADLLGPPTTIARWSEWLLSSTAVQVETVLMLSMLAEALAQADDTVSGVPPHS